MKTATILILTLVALTGCTKTEQPAASEAAISACYKELIAGIDRSIDITQYAQTVLVIRLGCEADSKMEPGPFRDKYGD